MINIQIGNTFRVRWRVLTNNEEKSFSGRDIKLLLLAPSGRDVSIVATEDTSAQATLTFVFQGADQMEMGVYRLALYENKGAASQSLTDEILAFRLVSTSSEATKDLPAFGGDPVVTCNTGNLKIGYQGDSAYESWLRTEKPAAGSDTEADFVAWLRKPSLDAAAIAEERGQYAGAQGDYAKTQGDAAKAAAEHAASTDESVGMAEQLRKAAESARVNAETERAESEASRKNAESTRSQNEDSRISAESTRIQNENNRRDAESSRTSAEQKRDAAESLRNTAETERQGTENARKSAESARVQAEQSRVNEFNTLKEESQAATDNANQAAAKAASDIQALTDKVNAAEQSRAQEFQTLKTDSQTATTAAKEAADSAKEAAADALQTYLAIEIDETTGDILAVVGAEKTVFGSGETDPETGDIILTINY